MKQVGRYGGLEHGLVMRAELGDDGLVRGTASTYCNADRMDRVILPGAAGRPGDQLRVPFLLNHKDDTPLGESVFTLTRAGVDHATDIVGDPVQPGTGVPIKDLLRKGYPATSIGWIPKKAHFGWGNVLKAARTDAALSAQIEQAMAMGVVQDENMRYFSDIEIVENSLVPIPANPRALLEAASVLPPDSAGRYELEAMVELAAGARHSQSDLAAIQRAHDAVVEAGAMCTMPEPPGEGPSADDHTQMPADGGVKGGWQNHMRSSYDDVLRVLQEHENGEVIADALLDLEIAAKYSAEQLRTMLKSGEAMANANGDPSYPIADEEDLGRAIRRVGSGGAEHDAIRRHIMKRARALNLADRVPDTWNPDGSLKEAAGVQLSEADGSEEAISESVDPGFRDTSEFIRLEAALLAAIEAGEREIADLTP